MYSARPYLIRAFYDWILDNHWTPYLVVNAEYPGVEVPTQYIEGGEIVLNLSPKAVQILELENSAISFQARFAGVCYFIHIPPLSVLAIYAKENGKGMVFADEDETPPPDKIAGPIGVGSNNQKKQKQKRPELKVVK